MQGVRRISTSRIPISTSCIHLIGATHSQSRILDAYPPEQLHVLSLDRRPFFVFQNIEMPRRARLCRDRISAPMCRQREDDAHHCNCEVSYILHTYLRVAARPSIYTARWIIPWKTTTTCPSSCCRPQTSRVALRVISARSTASGL